MAQIVIEFGAPALAPIMDSMLSLMGTPTVIETEWRTGGGETQPATKAGVEALSRQLTNGEIMSATFRTDSKSVRYGLILRPHYRRQNLSIWMGTVEVTTEEWRPYWEALLRSDALGFVCVGEEEGVELEDDDLTEASFPWDEWPMLAGALRSHLDGTWVIRERTTA